LKQTASGLSLAPPHRAKNMGIYRLCANRLPATDHFHNLSEQSKDFHRPQEALFAPAITLNRNEGEEK
jgi:hypothetical protein